MELLIGEVIHRLRKEKGVTQETLAKAVGVSVAAVSKWESKSSYPDITILPSIARFFNTTIDKLLSYEIEISNDEVIDIVKQCAQLFEKDSVENAIYMCEKYIKQYPNNMFLKFRIGSLYMMSISSGKNEEQARGILNKAIELLEESSKSNDKEISETSKYILTSLYTMDNKYDKAEEVLLSLPKVTTDRDDALIGLYINQDKCEEAKKILINMTYKRLSNLIMSLNFYVSLFLKNNDMSNSKSILNLQDSIIKIFDLESIYGVSHNLMFADIYAKEKNAEKTLDYIENIIDSFHKEVNLENHLLFGGIEFFEGVHSKNYILFNLKKILIEDKYDFIKLEERYKNIINELDNLIRVCKIKCVFFQKVR